MAFCDAQQFSGNIIPANRVSKAGLNTLLNFYPKPNLPGTRNGWFSNYAVDSPVTANTNQIDSRFDQVITQADRLYAIYHWGSNNQLVTDPYHGGTVVPGAGDADQANKQNDGAQSISVTEDHLFSPTKLNEFRFGYTRYYQDQYSLLNGTDYSAKYGAGNITVPGFSATVGFPYMFLADGYLAGGSTYKPYHVLDSNYQFTDYVTLTGISGHTIKIGGDLRKLNSHPNFSLVPDRLPVLFELLAQQRRPMQPLTPRAVMLRMSLTDGTPMADRTLPTCCSGFLRLLTSVCS